jgi:sulfate adenylyltransferase subunit 1 (EFTu-like GTPase family)
MILIDARKGILEQSKRHAFIASLLRIPHLLLCVNKMDLVDYDRAVFDEIKDEFTAWASRLDITDLTFIPISALHGDNVVDRSLNMEWYDGPSLLHHRGGVHRAGPEPHRLPVPGPVRDPARRATPTTTTGACRDDRRRRLQARRRRRVLPSGFTRRSDPSTPPTALPTRRSPCRSR